MVHPEGSTPL